MSKIAGQMLPFVGFSPDQPPSTPGIIAECTNIVPTNNGFAGAPTPVAQMPALAAACRGAAITTDIGGVRRLYAGAPTKLYLQVAGAWSDVGRAAAYTNGGDNLWSFCQFGNATIAANDLDVMQAAVSGASFADIATAPTAKIVVSAADFVLAFNTLDGTFGDQGDRWWCSAFRDHTSWTPSVTTQATTGRLIGDGGDLVAACRMGSQVVAYKGRSMFVGSYVGAPVVWQWDKVPGDVGCVGLRAVCDVGGPQLFVGEDNIWLFDGTRPVPLGVGVVRDWFVDNLSAGFKSKTICAYDPALARVWIYFVSTGSTDNEIDTALVYHLSRQTWGVVKVGVEAAVHYISSGVSMDAIPGTFDTMPEIGFDSAFWVAGTRNMAIFNRSHVLGAMLGSSASASFSTGDIGDDDQATMVRSLRLRYSSLPTTATVQGYTKPVSPAALESIGGSGSLWDGKFDCRQSGRWHRFVFNFTGDVEFLGLKVDASTAGQR